MSSGRIEGRGIPPLWGIPKTRPRRRLRRRLRTALRAGAVLLGAALILTLALLPERPPLRSQVWSAVPERAGNPARGRSQPENAPSTALAPFVAAPARFQEAKAANSEPASVATPTPELADKAPAFGETSTPVPLSPPAPPAQEEQSPGKANTVALVVPRSGEGARWSKAAALSVILDDLGVNVAATRRAIRLPAPLTLAFLPYGEATPELAREARAAGHEVFVHLPMEPRGAEDPGPMALLFGLPEEELRRRLLWAIARVPGAVGVNNHMGSRLTADRRAMAVVMGELARLSLPFVDSVTTPASLAGSIALATGVPATARDLFLDNDPSPAAIRAQLAKAERLARSAGTAVVIGHPYPETLAALAEWLPHVTRRGVHLVPATAIIRLRSCGLSGRDCILPAKIGVDARDASAPCSASAC